MQTVSQTGMRFSRCRSGSDSTTNVVTSSSLSAIGSSHAPEPRLLARPARSRPSRPSVTPAVTNTTSAHPTIAVDHQDDERRDQQHPQQRQLIRRRERRHRRPARASILVTASIASAPVTGLDGWKLLPGPAVSTPAATAADAAG